jgi:hypothetical protein
LLQKAVSGALHLGVVETQTDTLSRFINSIGKIDFVGYCKLLLSAAENYNAKNSSTMHLQNRRVNTHLFHDSNHDDSFGPYNINSDVDTILLNATRTQASCISREHWNQISVYGHAIWRQIPNEDCTIILDGCPGDTVSGLTDLTSPLPEDTIRTPFHVHMIGQVCIRFILVDKLMTKWLSLRPLVARLNLT